MCLWFSIMIHSWCLLIPVVSISWNFWRVGCKVNKQFMQANSWDECHKPWFTVRISMGLHADMEVCMIFMKQEAMRQDDWIFLEDPTQQHFFGTRIAVASRKPYDIADRRGKVRDWWFSGVALHHVPTWATSPRLHEGETMGGPRCAESLKCVYLLSCKCKWKDGWQTEID